MKRKHQRPTPPVAYAPKRTEGPGAPPPGWLLPAVCAGATVLLLPTLSIAAVFEMPPALVAPVGVLLAAAGWGGFPQRWLTSPTRTALQAYVIATALGLGFLGVATLALGAAGWLSRGAALTLIALGLALGAVCAYPAFRRASLAQLGAAANPRPAGARPDTLQHAIAILAGLLLAAPLAIALYTASLPPGVVWDGEARGYDALEYHLQGPREWYAAGRIMFLPHNVYTSFPQQMEMLFLLLIHLLGGPYPAAIPAQLLHALCGLLFAAALAAWSPRGWPRVAALLLGASVPWVAYLGALAYVELGMLFFAAVAAGLIAEAVATHTASGQRLLLAGLCAGFASGCKYTALTLVAAALVVAWLLASAVPLRPRLRLAAIYCAGVALAFSPWLLRNAAQAGNPVYPFAYGIFGGRAWSTDQDQQWARAHRPVGGEASALGRVRTTWREVFASPLFGPALFAAAAGGALFSLVRRRTASGRLALLHGAWALLALLAWTTLTHQPGRFALVLVVPLAMLAVAPAAGGALAGDPRRPGALTFTAIALFGAAINAFTLFKTLSAESDRWRRQTNVALTAMPGATDIVRQSHPLNQLDERLGRSPNYWLIGDAAVFYIDRPLHYTVVFNRDPWLEFARSASPADAVAWLHRQGVTHLVFSWYEIDRLRRTYGFPEFVTPAWVRGLETGGLVSVGEFGGYGLYEVQAQ